MRGLSQMDFDKMEFSDHSATQIIKAAPRTTPSQPWQTGLWREIRRTGCEAVVRIFKISVDVLLLDRKCDPNKCRRLDPPKVR